MKLFSLKDAEQSRDVDIKLTVVRSSGYRVFGSPNRVPDSELGIADLRDGDEPEDFSTRFQVLERHPMKPICLVRKLSQ